MTDLTPRPRLHVFDVARGIALVAMAIFHFNFDLELLGVKPPGYINQPHWVYFARSIASSFLFLVGVSIVLAHVEGINWRKFTIRLLKIAGAAALITFVTFYATPEIFIFFGILHNIALSSVLALVFLKLSWWITAGIGVVWLFARPYLQTPELDHYTWWWTGMSEFIPKSSDYVPMFPWFGFVLMGMAFAKWNLQFRILEKFSFANKGLVVKTLSFFGRNSLVFYLVHQPILIAIVFGYVWITG